MAGLVFDGAERLTLSTLSHVFCADEGEATMQRPSIRVIAVSAICAALAQPVLAGNLLTNGDFEAFAGPFPDGSIATNGPITTNPATWNIWRVWPRFQSVNDTTLIDPILPAPSLFPLGWGGENFAQHSQSSDDYTDQIKQGIDGTAIVPGKQVSLSFKYINTEGGRLVTVTVYGIGAGQSWSEFAPWSCGGCAALYTANIPIPYGPSLGWQTFTGSFTPLASYTVVAVGVTMGGNAGYARGVDDIVLSQNQPPVCTAAAPSLATLWSPNHEFVPIDVMGVTDPDGDAVSITVTGIKQDEPVNGLGDGDTAPDGAGVGTSTAQVRAERAGSGNGRFYHIAFTADDGNGGQCNGTVLVGVPKSQGKNGAPVDGGALFDSTTL